MPPLERRNHSQVRLRLGNKNESFKTFVLYFARLALTLHTESKSVLLT